MRKINFIILIAFFVIAGSSCTRNNSASKNTAAARMITTVYYTCTMHPSVHADKPGNCPKCGMELIQKEEQKPDTAKVIQKADSIKLK